VTVSKPEEKLVENWSEFTGRTAAVNFVNVTPRVSGYIVDIPFKEGDLVHQGDLLFQIDPRPYQDAYDQAVGQLQRAQASQKLQDITFERQERLQSTGVIAKEDYDTALANKNTAAADVIASQAAVNAAKLNLEFTHVTSPIDGRIAGRKAVSTSQMPAGKIIFGRWSDAVIATWVGAEVLVNPFIRAIQAENVITLNLFVAIAFKYSSAFVSSSDSASQ
jgi:RND family efflux transporter MFP subunit